MTQTIHHRRALARHHEFMHRTARVRLTDAAMRLQMAEKRQRVRAELGCDVLDKPWPRWQRWAFRAVLAAVVIALGVVIVSEYRAAVLTPVQVHAMRGGLR